MAEAAEREPGKPKWQERLRLALEVLTFGALVVTVIVYWRMSNTYEAQLAEMQKTNDNMQKEQKTAADARSHDSEQHSKERAEDQKTAADAKKDAENAQKRTDEAIQRLVDLKQRTDTVRYQLATLSSGFTQGFDDAVVTAYKAPWGNFNSEQLRTLAQPIVAQRKRIRDATGFIQANMTIIYNAVDSLIDELERELNSPTVRADRVHELLRLIYEEKDQIESKVKTAADVSLATLGCDGPSLASGLRFTIENIPAKQP